MCDDNESLSFQPEPDTGYIIHHHHLKAVPELDPHDLHWRPRPIEFRRSLLMVPEAENESKLLSPTSKLLYAASESQFVPRVEAFPIKLVYSVAHDSILSSEKEGFLLVSKAARVCDVIPAVRKAVAPDKSSSCVRIWSKMDSLRPDGTGATSKGDGYELVHVECLDDKSLTVENGEAEPSKMTMEEWVSRHLTHHADKIESLEILVETRATPSAKWAREGLELENRLQVQ